MYADHSKSIRGLGIAVIVCAALGLLACVGGFILMGLFGAYWDQYGAQMLHDSYGSGGHHLEMDHYDYSDYYDYGDVDMAMALVLGLGNIGFAFEALGCAVSLVAGIFALRSFNHPERLKGVFGWSLAGAICAFFTGRLITMVLLIIVCVFASKDRSALQAGYYGTAPAGYYAPETVAYGAGVYGSGAYEPVGAGSGAEQNMQAAPSAGYPGNGAAGGYPGSGAAGGFGTDGTQNGPGAGSSNGYGNR